MPAIRCSATQCITLVLNTPYIHAHSTNRMNEWRTAEAEKQKNALMAAATVRDARIQVNSSDGSCFPAHSGITMLCDGSFARVNTTKTKTHDSDCAASERWLHAIITLLVRMCRRDAHA